MTTKFLASRFAPYNGPLMLDDVHVTPQMTILYFTRDLGNIIEARPVSLKPS
jgi:hypothetical protein